eukprot:Tbor_TRINITY_DN4246_c0_g1::TRINITY_DN4246_c0_g1_i1::g.24028::m.24028
MEMCMKRMKDDGLIILIIIITFLMTSLFYLPIYLIAQHDVNTNRITENKIFPTYLSDTKGSTPSSLEDRVPVHPSQENPHHISTLLQFQSSCLSDWTNCANLSHLIKDGAIIWGEGNKCGFKNISFSNVIQSQSGQKYERKGSIGPQREFNMISATELLSTATLELQGDSTLREVGDLLVSNLQLGSLKKKDANRGARAPKYFYSQINFTKEEGRERRFFRIVFRFDFRSSHLAAPLADQPMMKGIGYKDQDKPVPFFEGVLDHYIIMSLGVHTAKHEVMVRPNKGMIILKGVTNGSPPSDTLSSDQLVAEDRIFWIFTCNLEDYLIQRVLGKVVVRDGKIQSTEGVPTEAELNKTDYISRFHFQRFQKMTEEELVRQPLATKIFFFEQTWECEAIQTAETKSFKEMAPFCDRINLITHAMMEYLKRTTWKFLQNEKNTANNGSMSYLHPQSSLRHLTVTEQITLASSVFYFSPLECRQIKTLIRFPPSLQYCSVDGVHLHSMFVRLKMDALINAIVGTKKAYDI